MIKKLTPKLNNNFIEQVSFYEEERPYDGGFGMTMVKIIKMHAKADGKDVYSLTIIDTEDEDEKIHHMNQLIKSLERWIAKHYKKKDLISYLINNLTE
jgi:hypothetical protein